MSAADATDNVSPSEASARPPWRADRLSQAPKTAVFRVSRDGGQSMIFKFFSGTARRRAQEEHAAITLVASGGLGVARALCLADIGDETTVLVTTDLGTYTLDRAVREGEMTRLEALELVGNLLARFHRIEAQPGPCLTARASATVATEIEALYRCCPAEELARIEPALRAVAGRIRDAQELVWCHGDLHFCNVVLSPVGTERTPSLIDFEGMTQAPRESDLAQAIVTTDAYDNVEQARLLAGYGSSHSLELLDPFIVFHTLRGWVYAALLQQRDQQLWASRCKRVRDLFPHVFTPDRNH